MKMHKFHNAFGLKNQAEDIRWKWKFKFYNFSPFRDMGAYCFGQKV